MYQPRVHIVWSSGPDINGFTSQHIVGSLSNEYYGID